MSRNRDNTTLRRKLDLRRNLLAEIHDPVVLETHGGWGHIGQAVYDGVAGGVVFEIDADKAGRLARQRPTWAVYQGDCVTAIAAGCGAHLICNVLDVDAYGDPWPVLTAWFSSVRPRADRMGVVVTDGLRLSLKYNNGWVINSLQAEVGKYGNAAMCREYTTVCRDKLAGIAAKQNYRLGRWAAYYCGHAKQMTHYAAVFTRTGGVSWPGY